MKELAQVQTGLALDKDSQAIKSLGGGKYTSKFKSLAGIYVDDDREDELRAIVEGAMTLASLKRGG